MLQRWSNLWFSLWAVALVITGVKTFGPMANENVQLILGRELNFLSLSAEGQRLRAETIAQETPEISLPRDIWLVVNWMKKHSVRSYQASPQILKLGRLGQRLLEGAWPIRVNENSCWRVRLIQEPIPAGYHPIEFPASDAPKEVMLDQCIS